MAEDRNRLTSHSSCLRLKGEVSCLARQTAFSDSIGALTKGRVETLLDNSLGQVSFRHFCANWLFLFEIRIGVAVDSQTCFYETLQRKVLDEIAAGSGCLEDDYTSPPVEGPGLMAESHNAHM
jgi:hypothetical protein